MANSGRAVIVILGSTGTGKSKLAIEIAKKFCGEIISADSMQVYKGLDIITNKVTESEKEGVQHHLLDYIDPSYNYTVTDFRNEALPIIDNLLEKKKLPVVVGGTNYYIESLLWKILVSKDVEANDSDASSSDEETDLQSRYLLQLNNEELHDKLKEIDPVMAARHHPSDRRKVIRSLEVYEQHGRLHSDIIAEQKLIDGGNSYGAPLRYENACIVWINSDMPELNERLDNRVDDMVNKGLLEELIRFYKKLKSESSDECRDGNYTKGILQSIGFKEFHNYLMLTDEERESDAERREKFQLEGVNRLKLVTRRYARKQIKWITNRFLRKPEREVPSVYKVDSTNVSKWNENVLNPTIDIVSAYMTKSRPSTVQPVPVEKDAPQYEQTTFFCDVCQRILLGELHWKIHLESKRHKKVLRSKKKKSSSDAVS